MSDVKTDLNQLVIFAKVVETRSFTAAGRSLGLPKSTVSRKVAQLEERLGVQLLQRTTRKLSLTEVGAAFYERCARISTEIEEAEQAVLQQHRHPRGLLRLTAPPEFGTAFLSEVVSSFLVAHAEIDIELELTDRIVDMIEEGFDLSIRFERPPDPTLISREFGPIHRHLVASPAYLQRHGTPTRPEQLEDHALVVLGNPRRNLTMELRGLEGETFMLEGRPRLVVNSMGMLREAVLAGVGVGILPGFKCAADLEQGKLRAFLHDWTQTDAAIHALYPTARHLSTKVRTFLDYLADRLEPAPWLASRPSAEPLIRAESHASA
jgi:DNA-binding transcriptional LysR family regulator